MKCGSLPGSLLASGFLHGRANMEDFVTVVDGKVTCAEATILTITFEDIENLREQAITKTQWELVVSRLRDWVDEELQNQVANALKGLN